MSKRNVGKLGESTLRTWTAQVGITANKSDEDETGWDFFVELPPDDARVAEFKIPLDRESFPLKCLVQVKSTDHHPGRREVKLDNWVRFVKDPHPAFFLVLEFDFQDSCQRAFLVHVDEHYIRRVLKRLRELDPGKRSLLHKFKLYFKYDESDALPSLDGNGLEQALRCQVGDSSEQYAVKKLETVRNVGYEEGGWRLHFSTPVPSSDPADIAEYLVDFTLGLVPTLDVTQGQITDVRFGIEALEPTEVLRDGRLELDRKPAGKGTIILRTLEGKRELRLSTDVYLPQGIGFELKDRHIKARFAAPFVDFVFWLRQEADSSVRLRFPAIDETHKLSDLCSVSALICLFHEAHTHNSSVTFESRFGSERTGAGQFFIEQPFDDFVVSLAEMIGHAWATAKYFDVHQDADIVIGELLPQKVRLQFLSSVLGNTHLSVRVTFWSEETSTGERMCVPYVIECHIGQYRITTAIAILGTVAPTGVIGENGYEYEIVAKDVKLCRTHLCMRDELPSYTHQDLVNSVVEEYQESACILWLDGINSGLVGSTERN